MNLSKNFTLEEMTYSDIANKYHASNSPSEIHLNTLKHTCNYLLEPLRALLNKFFVGSLYKGKKIKAVIIKITSGYRSELLNHLLEEEGKHPAKNSQHCKGEAADIRVVLIAIDGTRFNLPYTETFKLIKSWVLNTNQLSVDQCIQEKQGVDTWVHISHSAWGKTKDRKQFFEINI